MTPFGKLPDGRSATLHTLVNANGVRADITDYGATLVRLLVPDHEGRMADVVLGYNAVEDYVAGAAYHGAVIGRCGNRIAHGRFRLDGRDYALATNNAPGGLPCHLHGGVNGFDKVLWQVETVSASQSCGLRLRYLSRDGEEGYPGNLDVTVHYWLGDDDALTIDYRAVTDRATPVNLTQHAYFNLRGEGSGDILDHVLTLHASRITPVDRGLIPTGQLMDVVGTSFDFTAPRRIGERIDDPHEQLHHGAGYDHNWVLDKPAGEFGLGARVEDPVSGRVMEMWTQEPGVQLYTGNFLGDPPVGKSGRIYPRRSGFCLETQHYPDSPNQPSFPGVILRPGEEYRTRTSYRFHCAPPRG